MPELTGDRLRELRRAEEWFRLVAETVDAVIIIAAADLSTVEYVSPAYEDLYGQPTDRLSEDPRSFLDAVHPDDRERYEADLDRMVDSFARGDVEDLYEDEYRLAVDDGTRWVRVRRYPIDEDGSVERFVSVTEDVTDRRELERTYRELFERTSDGLVLHDPETGEIVDANERFCEMNGYAREELVGERIDAVTADEDGYGYDEARERVRRAREEGSQLFEWRNRRRDGTIYPVEVHLTLVDVRGEERVLASVRDVTDRKRREREREEERQKYTTLVEGSSDGVVIVQDGRYAFVNDRFCEITGRDRADLLDAAFDEVFVEADRDLVRERYDRRIAGEEPPTNYDVELRTAAGERVDVELTVSRISHEGEPATMATFRDITERKRLERELRRRDRRFRLIAEHIDEVIYLATADFSEILYVNPAYEEIYGEPVEALDEHPTSFVEAAHPDDRQRYERDVERMIDDIDAGDPDDSYEGEYRLRVDGETRWVRVTRSPVADAEGAVDRVVGTVADVTDQRELERTYREVFESVSDGLVVHDPETGEILDANDRYCELTGYAREELVGERVDLVTPGDPAYPTEDAEDLIEAAREEGPQLFEWKGQRADGETFDAEINLSVVSVRGAERVLASVRDVSERKRHERIVRALHESTERIHEAETTEAVCEATVAAMEEVLDLSLPVCWLRADDGTRDENGDTRDDERAPLEPVAASDDAWAFADGPGSLDPGTFEYDLFLNEESAVYDPSERWDRTPLNHALMVAVGGHGVIGAADPGVDEFDEVVLDAARILARHTTTALDRVARAAERRESERRMSAILDRIDEAIFLTDSARLLGEGEGDIHVSAGYEDVFGRPYDAFGEDEPLDFIDVVHPDDRAEYQEAMREWVREVQQGSHDDRYTFEYRIERPDGAIRWIRSDFYPIEWTDDTDRFVIVSRDVTARKEREDTLETFHEATRELTECGSRTEASQVAVDAADRVLGFSHVSIHLYDEDEGALRPVSETDRLRETLDFLPSFEPGAGLPWQVFVDGETARGSEIDAEAGLYGSGVADPDLLLPLGSHGVMLVGAPSKEFDAETVELAQILAATLEGALNHVRGQHELEAREAELREHRERAERLERLNTVIREIEQATVEESTRDAIEAAVCEQLVTVEPYQVAWIAEPDRRTDALVSRTKRGDDEGYVDTLAVDLDGSGVDRHPAAAAFASGETRTVRNLATRTSRGEWRKPILRAGYQSVAAVPLVHDGTVSGVLTIVADDPTAFDDRAEAILTELGRSVGYAISVLERRAALESDTTTELEFAGRDDDLLFVRIARETDADVTLERTVRRASGTFGTFYTVEGADPDAVAEEVAGLGGVSEATLVSADDAAEACLIEVETPSWFGTALAEYGAVVRTAELVDDVGDEVSGGEDGSGREARVVVEAPQAADIRTLVTSFREQYPDVELVAQRTRERSVQTLLELQDVLGEQLTDRQLETLETAYSAGYFEWPRESSGQEIAELLDITQPTFNKHLRTAERKTFSMLLNREYPD
ncbi:PAS domain S-box protein [Salinigranum sp. GCM10025319]|uniref:PAS domain S-box protein n=1 Tax=Salinigranum sp. GCM10025319 TaxID=3252687 RepID=UPI00360FF738